MSHYETLGVPRTATAAEIKAAYRRASSAAHPDRDGGSDDAMQAVNLAYEVLGDAERRARYDATGEDDRGNAIEQEARGVLVRLFKDALEVPGPVVEFARNALDALKVEAITAKAQAAKRATRLKRRRATVVLVKGDSDNLFHMLADEQIAATETHIKQCDTLIAVTAAARHMVDQYESIEEEPVPTSSRPNMGFLGLMDGPIRWSQA